MHEPARAVSHWKDRSLTEAADAWLSTFPPGMTRKSYAKDLEIFVRFLNEDLEMRSPYVHEVGLKEISSYRDAESERVSPTTQRRRIFALRSFFSWAASNGYTARNYAADITLPRKSTHLPTVLSSEEIKRLLRMPPEHTWMGIRDRSMLSLCYYAGLRISELCSLKTNSYEPAFYFPQKQNPFPAIFVSRKGGKKQDLPIHPDAERALKKWLKVREKNGPVETDVLYLVRSGEPISDRSFRHALNKYATLAGVEKDISPHTLRHSFATHLLQGDRNIILISKYLGHSKLETTAIYTHLTNDEYAEGILSLPSFEKRRSR